jgi:DNA-binding transcriptional MerR regulator
MGLSIDELVHHVERKGYKITPYGVKYYIREGLLPRPIKRSGGYKEGVRLIFPDAREALTQFERIFELKGWGYKLAEIKKVIRDEAGERSKNKRKKIMEKIIEIDGQFYFKLNEEADINKLKHDPDESWTDDLEKKLFKYYNPKNTVKGDSEKVIKLKLYLPIYLYKDKPLYLQTDIFQAFAWIKLRRSYEIAWDTLKALHRKHVENFDKFFFWPDADGINFSKKWVNWQRQKELNNFGEILYNYTGRMIDKTIDRLSMDWGNWGEPETAWDSGYASNHTFFQDFLEGKCAFVPTAHPNIRYFLKKFEE